MNERFVIVLVIKRKDNILFLKRSQEKEEYKGYWSLPSLIISKNDYNECLKNKTISSNVIEKFKQHRFPNISLISKQYLISGIRIRTNYILYMSLFEAETSASEFNLNKGYTEVSYFKINQLLELSDYKLGTCCSLYIQYLINIGIMPLKVNYLEVPPELADSNKDIEEYLAEELWHYASPNYPLLIQNKSGGDGSIIKDLTLNIFLEKFIHTEINDFSFVLDIGCGNGELLNKIHKKTKNAFGLELFQHSKYEVDSKFIVHGHVYNASDLFKNYKFDWLILNLVIQWIPDLNELLNGISGLVKNNGQIIISLPTPEFSHNGKYLTENEDISWCIEKPYRRTKEIVMLNRLLGPLWFYPRSILEIINTFVQHDYLYVEGQYLYLDNFLEGNELQNILNQHPLLKRYIKFPEFIILKFKYIN